MDFSTSGVGATHSKLNALQQRQQQQQQNHQSSWLLFQQQQPPFPQPSGYHAAAPSTLTPTPAAPWSTADPRSSISTQSSQSWQDASLGNPSESLSSPASSPPSPTTSHAAHPAEETPSVQPVDLTETPKRRRGRPRLSEMSQRAGAASTPAKTVKKGKRQRASTASASEGDALSSHVGGGGGGGDGNGDDDKKNRVRARNREAAHKCRQKTQKGVNQLQAQEAVMGGTNKTLKTEAEMLRGEILLLKHMVLQHGGCGCSFIEEYISGAAQNLVQSGACMAAPSYGGNARTESQRPVTGDGEGYIERQAYDTLSKAEMPSTGELGSNFLNFDYTAHPATGAQS